MNAVQHKKIEIMGKLAFVPANRLDEIQQFIEYILFTAKTQKKEPISVRGIWENKGFEKLDIEKELKNLRKEIRQNLERKKFD